ncbi:hypothetical protein GHT06_007931 [Daphnia sinensis]|uniref:Uncharacterized protein n=1 Tax=Daphnia sinensis TaxID=1820382 RepID=A0AAD5L155_9CRUS|nr:hypothetical protein GHT06_007931 [Daphnia sinensis]
MNPFWRGSFFSGLRLITCRKEQNIRTKFKRALKMSTLNNLKTEDERRKNKCCTRKRAAPHRCVHLRTIEHHQIKKKREVFLAVSEKRIVGRWLVLLQQKAIGRVTNNEAFPDDHRHISQHNTKRTFPPPRPFKSPETFTFYVRPIKFFQ